METIGKQELWSFFDNSPHVSKGGSLTLRAGGGHRVRSYLELAKKVAELQFRNPEHVLLFRGQDADHRNEARHSTLKPTLFRPLKGSHLNPDQETLRERFERLARAEAELVARYSRAHADPFGLARLKRYRILRWSVLQHYEVCDTPLLDVSHSLRMAASFASLSKPRDGFIFVLGVPNLSGAITASAEAGLQIVRLSSVCPPAALRPHIQEGYLLGEYPEMAGYDQKSHYQHYEIDFGRRLVAKFRFNPIELWNNEDFRAVSRAALYPPLEEDPLCQLAMEIKTNI